MSLVIMDVSIGDEITPVEVDNGTHQLSKDKEYSLQPNGSNVPGLSEMVITRNCDDCKNSPHFVAGTLDAESVDRIGTSAHASASPRCNVNLVEELTLRNYSSEHLGVSSTKHSRDKSRQSNWHKLYQRAGGCGNDGPREDAVYRLNTKEISDDRDNVGCTAKSEAFDKKSSNNNYESGHEVSRSDVAYGFNTGEMSNVQKDVRCIVKSELVDRKFASNNPNDVEELVSSKASLSLGGIKTKILSNSGFTQYIVKDTLKDKGVTCREPVREETTIGFSDQTHAKAALISSNKGTIVSHLGAQLRPNMSSPHSGVLLSSNNETIMPPHAHVQLGSNMPPQSIDLMHPACSSALSNSHRETFMSPQLRSNLPSHAGASLNSTIPHSGAMLSMPPHSSVPSPHSGALLSSNKPSPDPGELISMPRRNRGALSSFLGAPLSSNMSPHTGALSSANMNRPNLGAVLSSDFSPHSRAQLRPSREIILPPSHSSELSNSTGEIVFPHVKPKHLDSSYPHGGVCLREWLNSGKNKLNKMKNMHIFKHIVDVVSDSHSRKAALLDLRPSYFKLLLSDEIIYLGSSFQNETGEKFSENVQHSQTYRHEKRPSELTSLHLVSPCAKKIKSEDYKRPHFPYRSGITAENETDVRYGDSHGDNTHETHNWSVDLHGCDPSKLLLTSVSDSLELKWYASPEECCTLSSNIYSLGVLLFELLCYFESEKARASAMLDLRYRILPPTFLSETPKEAGFCLWLLHPEPSSRPTTREILNSDFIKEFQEANESLSTIKHKDAESDFLLHFLESLKEQKDKHASKLEAEINFLEADIDEVEKRRTKQSLLHEESLIARTNVFSRKDKSTLGENSSKSAPVFREERMMKNIKQLESAYFSVRSTVQRADNEPINRVVDDILESREICNRKTEGGELDKSTDRLGAFFNGLCKYARYSKFKVRSTSRNGDLSNSANVICSLSFDRDEDYFAAAGVSKKIKIYDFHAFLNNSVDIHYPVIELSSKSKFSCTSWNNYIGNYLASTDYDGVVKIWDAGTGQEISQYTEHSRRAWSVDFSLVDPTKLASGSDDCSVKLWNINEKSSLCTIRNIANVCCVQFSPKSSHLLAFGSADYKTYCYDLRNVSTPWCVLSGHARAVSYVKFIDSETLISASTDNTLKLWDLKKTSTSVLPNNGCISTLRGHTNEKNFVGLSVSNDGYIVCGSETNEVFSYYRSLPMPITSHKFGSVDPITGKETDDDGGHFVSSVCWRKKSDMVVAANSTGSIKLLQLV